jgi:hypothetical protein
MLFYQLITAGDNPPRTLNLLLGMPIQMKEAPSAATARHTTAHLRFKNTHFA